MEKKYVVVCEYTESEVKLPEYLREFNSVPGFYAIMAILKKLPKSPFKSIDEEKTLTKDITLYQVELADDEEYYIETKLDHCNGKMVEYICFRKKQQERINSIAYVLKKYDEDIIDIYAD